MKMVFASIGGSVRLMTLRSQRLASKELQDRDRKNKINYSNLPLEDFRD